MILDPLVFERAAERIETRGWCAVNTNETNAYSVLPPPAEEHRLEGRGRECITSALSMSVGGSIRARPYLARLVQHLAVSCKCGIEGCDGLSAVWRLNDAQPDYYTGKAWAVNTLRNIAVILRREQAS